MWNPAISSYKMEDFNNELHWLSQLHNPDVEDDGTFDDEPDFWYMNWSVWEHDRAQDGDRFFMVRVGDGPTGIVMSGYFDSDPYRGDDWSGKNRVTYYMNLDCDMMVNSEHAPYITTKQLMEEIPDFDWTGGHSGRLLDETSAEKLEAMWLEYVYNNFKSFDCKNAFIRTDDIINDFINETLGSHLRQTRSNACEICGYDYQQVFGKNVVKDHNYYKLFLPSNQTNYINDSVWKHVHCLCKSCAYVDENVLRKKLGEPLIDE